jgi:P27 family predicted phage terminase small subunit
MPGPPPEPNEKKRRRGNPGKRPLPELASVVPLRSAADVDVPSHLGANGSRVWVMALRDGGHWIAPTDLEALLLLCEAADRRADLLARVDNDGPVLYTDKGYAYAHPAVGMVSNLEQQMTKWLSLLGFTASDRSRLGVAEVKAQSKLEEMKARRDQRTSVVAAEVAVDG